MKLKTRNLIKPIVALKARCYYGLVSTVFLRNIWQRKKLPVLSIIISYTACFSLQWTCRIYYVNNSDYASMAWFELFIYTPTGAEKVAVWRNVITLTLLLELSHLTVYIYKWSPLWVSNEISLNNIMRFSYLGKLALARCLLWVWSNLVNQWDS